MSDVDPKQRLDTKEAAKLLGRKVNTLEKWRQKGKGPKYRKHVGSITYMLKDLLEWDESCVRNADKQ